MVGSIGATSGLLGFVRHLCERENTSFPRPICRACQYRGYLSFTMRESLVSKRTEQSERTEESSERLRSGERRQSMNDSSRIVCEERWVLRAATALSRVPLLARRVCLACWASLSMTRAPSNRIGSPRSSLASAILPRPRPMIDQSRFRMYAEGSSRKLCKK